MYIYLCSRARYRSRASVVDELRELDIESYLYHFLTSDTPVSCTDRSFGVLGHQCIVTSRRISFGFVCVCFFFFSKIWCPLTAIMTDRLQQFELKIFVCVLLKKVAYFGCPAGGEQINN